MKKILSLLLALILVGSMAVSAYAAAFQVDVSETVIEAGEEVTVTITLDETLTPVETTGFRNIQGQLIYDPEILTYVSHEMAEAYKHYSSKDMPARKYFTFSYTAFNEEGFAEIPAGTVVTIVYRATEEIEASHLAASLSLELKTNEPGKDAVWYKNAATVVICKEHTWDAGKVTTEPTCTEAGEQVFTCTYEGCGATKTEPVEALGHTSDGETDCTKVSVCTVCGETLRDAGEHSYVSEVITEVTCTTDGEVKYTCESCAYSYTETVEALGHTEETIPGKAATCTEPGLTDGVKCTVCGETLVEQEEIAALGHTEETIPGKAATCTESGLTDGVKCTVCGETLVEQEEIAALGHTEETIPGKAATCTESGLTDGVKCSVCGETLAAQEEIAALGHTEETIPGKAATCTESGLTDGVKCAVCGETLVEQEEIPAGHTEETVPGKAATCTESGLTDGVKCSVCGETLVEQEEIAALGHTEETIPGKAATCTESGLTDGVKCSVCGETLVEQEEIAALGHTEETIPGKEATCTEPGLTDGVKCSVCGEVLVEQEEIPADGHNYVDGTCSVCGAKDPDEEEPDQPSKPSWGSWWDKWFGSWWGDEEECEHSYTSVVTDPTCTKKGYTTHTCDKCGDSYKDNYVDATGHSYVNGVCEYCGKKQSVKPGWSWPWFWPFW